MFKGDMVYQYSTVINPHLRVSSVRNFEKEEQENFNDININESESEEQYLENKTSHETQRVNMWSLLGGREVKVRITENISESLEYVDDFFICYLREKNPFYQEKYSLMFTFNNVMEESGYTSNKFIM